MTPTVASDATRSAGVSADAVRIAAALLGEVRAAVDARLAVVLSRAADDAGGAGPEPHAVFDAVADLVRRGGKRLRPALVAAGYAAAGGSLTPMPEAVVDAGVAFELLQAYFLVHDDWMDGDRERRGGPSVHAVLEQRHRDVHLAASLAVLGGDLASGLAHEVMAAVPAEPGRVVEALRAFCRMEQDVVLGQTLDLTLEADALPAAVERMHARKTGSYTVRGPLTVGAILAGGSEQVHDSLRGFGEPLGVAFQLRDDLLGTFGDPGDTGKPVGSDLRSGKRTALVAAALARCDEAERARLISLLAGASSTHETADDELRFALELFERRGIRAELESRIEGLVAQASSALGPLEASAPHGATLLLGLAATLTRRSR